MLSDQDGRRHVALGVFHVPVHMRLRDIAGPRGADRHHVVRGKSGRHEEIGPVEHGRRHKLLRGTVDRPVAFAVGWIKADNAAAARDDHLGSAVNRADNRRHVAAGFVFARHLPHRLTGLGVERHQVRIAIVVTVDDHQVLVQDRAAAESVDADECPRFNHPLAMALHVVGCHDHLAGSHWSDPPDVPRRDRLAADFQKRDDHLLAISDRCAGREAVQRVFGFQRSFDHGLAPQGFATAAIQAHQDAVQLVGDTGCDKHAVLPDDG